MKRTLALLLLLCLLLPACGYRFAGAGRLPGGAETISVLMLKNDTPEIGIQSRLNSDISYEVTRRDSRRITRPENADLLLSGVVKTVRDTDIAHTGTSTASQRRVTVRVDMQLARPDGDVLWRSKGLSDYEAYDVGTDQDETAQNRQSAVEKLSRRLAETIYNSITTDF